MDKYRMSFWNYTSPASMNDEDVVSFGEDISKLGINLAMTPPYREPSHKETVLKVLDECHKRGIKAFVSDIRTSFYTLNKIGEDEFRKGVAEAVADFGSHPATYGFLIGDEPDLKLWDDAVNAFNIVKEATPTLNNLLNFFPCYWNGFEERMGCPAHKYEEYLDDFLKRTGASILSYDYYSQCCYDDRSKWIDIYFKNLNMFRKVAEKNGAELFTSLLSVGHWMYRCPNEDDFRWQISTAVAHGVVGIMWFFIFQKGMFIENYRTAPIDVFGEHSETFEWLSRQDRIFMLRTAKLLDKYKFDRVEHWTTQYGETPIFKGEGVLKSINPVEMHEPLAITYFKTDDGETCVGITNLSQEKPTIFDIVFEGQLSKHTGRCHLAPGQMRVYTKEATV